MSFGDTTLTVIGNLTADPDLRFAPNGNAVASFTIAATRRTYDQSTNSWKDGDTLFMRAVAWKQLAEQIAESLTKGTRVIAHGRLKQRDYEKDGIKRTIVELDIEEIGPSLKYATAKVTRVTGNGAPHPATQAGPTAHDAWSTPAPAGTPAAVGANGSDWSHDSEPPF